MMKNLKKMKVNPAFKQRQILPFLAAANIRLGVSAKPGAKTEIFPNTPAPGLGATWVRTE